MKTLTILFAGTAMALAGSATAQSAQEQMADPATTMSAPESRSTETTAEPMMEEEAATAEYSDAEVQNFSAAVVEIQGLSGDEAAKQQQAAQIVADSGLDAETFNAIGAAMQSDPELAERVKLAAAEIQSQPAG